MATPAEIDDDAQFPHRQPLFQRGAELLLIVVVFFTIAGDPPPHVNEAHYLSRLKHYWNPQWCAGDMFLKSKDAQLVFVWTFGWVTRWLSLTATAWVGRLIAWTMLAWAWQRLSWRLVPTPLAAVLSAAVFIVLNERAHLAGEWIVGGVEAKCFAYGFVLFALAELVDRRWNRMWLLLGAATAFHPVVGGWSAMVSGVMWIWACRRGLRLRSSLPALAGFVLLASLGVVPALMLTWNEPAEIVAEASRIYVFERLPHHLAVLTLPANEIAWRLGRHATLLVGLWVLSRSVRESALRNMARFAVGAALLAAIGIAIELAFWNQPLVAARLLRYYWFRLTDFAAPMAAALYLTALITSGMERRRPWAAWLLTAAIVVTGWHLSNVARQRMLNPVPPADAQMHDFAAWVEACEWVAENTPEGALFLTPRLNHTFKWRAGRPEVVNRKDIPQDARSIVEWHRRIKDIYYTQIAGVEQPFDSIGILGTERVRELALKYGADYVFMDRGQLLSLPRVFWNEEYVVYRIEDRRAGNSR